MNKTAHVMHFIKTNDENKNQNKNQTNENDDFKAKTSINFSSQIQGSNKEVDDDKKNNENSITNVKMPNIYNQHNEENTNENEGNTLYGAAMQMSPQTFKIKFGFHPDVEKIKEELYKLKKEFNKKSQEYHVLKKDYFKLQEEHNQSLKVFQEILNDPKTNPEIFNIYGGQNEDRKEFDHNNSVRPYESQSKFFH
jgi:hypothetical protein